MKVKENFINEPLLDTIDDVINVITANIPSNGYDMLREACYKMINMATFLKNNYNKDEIKLVMLFGTLTKVEGD